MSGSDFKDSASIGESEVFRDILFNFLQEDKIMLSFAFQPCNDQPGYTLDQGECFSLCFYWKNSKMVPKFFNFLK